MPVLITGCRTSRHQNIPSGFWEGPHPREETSKFCIHIYPHGKGYSGDGYWTHDGFYNSAFEVDSLGIRQNSIRFYVPSWGCFYAGLLDRGKGLITGGFYCRGETFDTVNLQRKEGMENYLLLPIFVVQYESHN